MRVMNELCFVEPCCSVSVGLIPTRDTQCAFHCVLEKEVGQGSGQGVKLSTHFLEVFT